jgi:hypothetical protein
MHIVNGDVSNADEKLVATVTGEYVQPVRLYYRLKDKRALKKVFSKLKCMDYDASRDRYVWLYQKEAKKLTFKYPYSAVPAEQRPVVIGSFFSESVDEMYLEVRSIERALQGIVFFDTYIKPYMASIDSISVINKLFSFAEHTMDFSDYFDQEVTINSEEKALQLQADFGQGKTLEKLEEQSLPLVERFPCYFNDDGVTPLKLLLLSRQSIAIQHWMGNTEYTLQDYMLEVVNRQIKNQQ